MVLGMTSGRRSNRDVIGLTPAKAQELAKRYLEPGAAKDQVSKTAGDLGGCSSACATRTGSEVTAQMKTMGVATQDDRRPPQARPGTWSGPRPYCVRPQAPRGNRRRRRRRGPPRPPRRPPSELGHPDGCGPVGRRPLDTELVRRGLVGTPAEARRAIGRGQVTVGGAPATKGTTLVAPDDALVVRGPARPFVSRGGEKPRRAGCVRRSTGWPRCARRGRVHRGLHRLPAPARGPPRARAIDVGYGQLAWELRTDARVTVMDRTNVRDLGARPLLYQPSLLVADLSFVSLGLALAPLVSVAATSADLVRRMPQFEAARDEVNPAAWCATRMCGAGRSNGSRRRRAMRERADLAVRLADHGPGGQRRVLPPRADGRGRRRARRRRRDPHGRRGGPMSRVAFVVHEGRPPAVETGRPAPRRARRGPDRDEHRPRTR